MQRIILTRSDPTHLATDIGRTSLSYSTQSGRQFKDTRSRTMSPSVGSIKLSGQLVGRALAKRVAGPVLETLATEKPSPVEEESPAKESIPEKQVESEGKRRKGARKNLTAAVTKEDEQPKSKIGAELEDEEDLASANSEPSLGHEDDPEEDPEVDSPAKKKVRRDRKTSPAQRCSTGKGIKPVEKGRASAEKPKIPVDKAGKTPASAQKPKTPGDKSGKTPASAEKPKTPVDKAGKTPVVQRVSHAKITRSAQKKCE